MILFMEKIAPPPPIIAVVPDEEETRKLAEDLVQDGGLTGNSITFKPWVQTISTSLVYRFNWGDAPVQARY
jgi:hypothetical protein